MKYLIELVRIRVAGIRIQYNVVCEIKDFFKFLRRHIQDQAHSGRNSLEIPDMGDRRSQLDVTHALAADGGLCDLDAAAVADNTFITDLLVLAAVTFPVLRRPENTLAEQTVFFRLQRSVVDRLRFFYFAVRPLTDLLR